MVSHLIEDFSKGYHYILFAQCKWISLSGEQFGKYLNQLYFNKKIKGIKSLQKGG